MVVLLVEGDLEGAGGSVRYCHDPLHLAPRHPSKAVHQRTYQSSVGHYQHPGGVGGALGRGGGGGRRRGMEATTHVTVPFDQWRWGGGVNRFSLLDTSFNLTTGRR